MAGEWQVGWTSQGGVTEAVEASCSGITGAQAPSGLTATLNLSSTLSSRHYRLAPPSSISSSAHAVGWSGFYAYGFTNFYLIWLHNSRRCSKTVSKGTSLSFGSSSMQFMAICDLAAFHCGNGAATDKMSVCRMTFWGPLTSHPP
ncbi:hypothetical protein E2C01_014922 [Portunus trituberculatus]|uniref:Uncharacterized protein n=1 Tax=Portunus trituberculatus TaxID=210409 RepID=A0A5B7DLG1_PORTR|nr:hypothetical protein [Portunus trituberculatus]